jgi:hypothetical protein
MPLIIVVSNLGNYFEKDEKENFQKQKRRSFDRLEIFIDKILDVQHI